MAAIHPTDLPPPKQTSSRTSSATSLVQDVVHTTQFSLTHIARLLLMLPWVVSGFQPALQRLYILHPPTFSSPMSLYDTGVGADLHPLTAMVGCVTLVWSQMLEARRRQKMPASTMTASGQKQTSRWTSTLGGFTEIDVRSIKAWSRFDCVEAACICGSIASGIMLTKFDFTLAYRIAYAIACLPGSVVVIVIFKRMIHAVVYTQGDSFPLWVTDTANHVLSKALFFEVVVIVMWAHASIYVPYPRPQLEYTFAIMLDTGNNSAILCDNEAAFWASFSLPFEWSVMHEPLECDEPTCGYTSWQDLCQARRLAPLADMVKRTVWYLSLTVPILLLLIINLIGNGRIARGSNGELNLKGLLAPHILLTLGLGFCVLSVGIYYTATFLIHVPQLMSGQAPSDPRVCLHSSPCGQLWNALYLGVAAFGLLPIDTFSRFLKQRSNRSRSYFLSYKQDDQNDGAVQMVHSLLPKCWLDKYADNRSEEGMVAGVTESDVFVAMISPKYFSSYFCCLEMHTALSQDKRILVVWNQSKFRVQDALGWIPPELSMLKSNELLPIQEDIQMATTCVARIEVADIKTLNASPKLPWTTPEELQPLNKEELFGIRAILAGVGSQEETAHAA